MTAATAVISAGYAAWLLPSAGTGLPGWLRAVVVALGVAAVVAVVLVAVGVPVRGVLSAGPVLALAALLVVPTVASASIAVNRLGPFDTPFQPEGVTLGVRTFFDLAAATDRFLPRLEQVRRGAPYLMATQTSALAAPFIFASGQEVLPIGGFTGTIPEPTLATLRSLVHAGAFHLVLLSASTTDPRLVWVTRHCLPVAQPAGAASPSTDRIAIFYCLRTS